MSDPTKDDSPESAETDSLEVHEPTQPICLSDISELVSDALAAMNAAGEEAEEAYQRALVALRQRPFEAVIEIARQEAPCSEADYATRWGLIQAACELEHRAALPLLKSIVLTPIPPERSRDPHASTVAEETIIRTTAVGGVATLALEGDRDAIEMLFEFLELPSFSIRRAAVQGLLGSPKGEDLRGRIGDCLPKGQRFILDLKRVDVRKAPQIEDARMHLSEKGRQDHKSSAPSLSAANEERQTSERSARDSDTGRADPDEPNESPTM